MRVGVLALQGAFAEHINSLRKLGIDAIEVRTKEDLQQVDALILPGGESTAQVKSNSRRPLSLQNMFRFERIYFNTHDIFIGFRFEAK
jgi:glutamine amidotransferase PdxT